MIRLLLVCVFNLFLCSQSLFGQSNELRQWTDSTGRFKVQAELIEVKGSDVYLKTADGKTLKIPVARLSSQDQEHLKQADNPFEMVDSEEEAGRGASMSASRPTAGAAGGAKVWATPKAIEWELVDELIPAPGTEWNVTPPKLELDFEPKRAGLPAKSNFHENMYRPVVNLQCKRAVVGHTVSFAVPKPQSRISLIDMVSGRAIHSAQVEARMRPLTLMDGGTTLLMVGTSDERGGYETGDQLQLWNLEGKKIVRSESWIPHPQERTSFGKTVNAAIGDAWPITSNLVLTLSNSAHLVLWNIYGREAIWHARLNTRNFGVDVSADRRFVAIFNDKTVMVVDAKTAEVKGATTLDARSVGWNRIRWSPSGKRLLMSSVGDLRVLNVETGEIEIDFHLSDSPIATKNLSFPHEDYALLDDSLLVHLPSRIKVCQYRDGRIRVVGDTAFIAVQGSSAGVFVAASFPHPKAEDTLKAAQEDPTMFLLHPGVQVSLDVSRIPSQYRSEVESGLRKSIEASGYKYASGAPIVAVASISGPKTEAVSYIARGSYVVNQFDSSLQLKWNGKSVWSRSGTNIPHMLSTNRGESIKEALDRLGKRPNTSMFSGLKFPEFMQRPSEQNEGQAGGNALMTSKFTLNGLQDSR